MRTNARILAILVLGSSILSGYGTSSDATFPYYGSSSTPTVRIAKTKDMSASMQLDAIEAFRRAYTHLNLNTDRCSIVRQLFVEKYPEYKWHVAMYKAYSIQSVKSIDVNVNEDNYVLFATVKSHQM